MDEGLEIATQSLNGKFLEPLNITDNSIKGEKQIKVDCVMQYTT